ncbi:hypothetical protein [Streptomyces sp. NPDC088400]
MAVTCAGRGAVASSERPVRRPPAPADRLGGPVTAARDAVLTAA